MPLFTKDVAKEVEAYNSTVEKAKSRLVNNLHAMSLAVEQKIVKTRDAILALRVEEDMLEGDRTEIDAALKNVSEVK